MTPSENIADQMLARTVRLQRVGTALSDQIQERLPDLRKKLISELSGGFSVLGVSSVARLAMTDIQSGLRESLLLVVGAQVAFARKVIEDSAAGRAGGLIGLPMIMGASFDDWFSKIERDLLFRIEARLNSLFATDRDADIPQDLLLTEIVMAMVALEALIRTALQAILNAVTREIVSRSFVSGYRWQQVSVLDSRTSRVCREYAFKEWDAQFQPIDHDLPFADGVPRHWHCRSVVVPVFGPAVQLTLDRWMANGGRSRMQEIFGRKHLALFDTGVLSISDLVRQASRPLSIDEM